MEAWLIWLVVAVAAFAGEIATLGFFLAPFGVGAVGAMVADLAGAPTGVGFALFAVLTAVSFLGLRPIARRHLHQPSQTRTGAAALIGQSATVIEAVAHDAGTVKLDGEIWTARPYDEDHEIAAGARVQVIEIRGATALVSE